MLGAATGAAIVVFAGPRVSASGPTADRPAEKVSVSPSWNEQRIARLEAELSNVQRAAASAAPRSEVRMTPEPPPRRETQEELTQAHQDLIAEHWREPQQSRWSAPAEATFQNDLAKLATTGKFTVNQVDCRTATCIATLSWASRGDAKQAMPEILHAHYQTNCGRTLHLPDATEGASTYEATVVFDCAAELGSIAGK
jgi:hypothetical protein